MARLLVLPCLAAVLLLGGCDAPTTASSAPDDAAAHEVSAGPFAAASVSPPQSFLDACVMASIVGPPTTVGGRASDLIARLAPQLTWEPVSAREWILRQSAYDAVAQQTNRASYLFVLYGPAELEALGRRAAGPGCGPSGVLLRRVVMDGVELAPEQVFQLTLELAAPAASPAEYVAAYTRAILPQLAAQPASAPPAKESSTTPPAAPPQEALSSDLSPVEVGEAEDGIE